MTNVLQPPLAVAVLHAAGGNRYAQGKDAEVKQDQVKEAARRVEREGTIVDKATMHRSPAVTAGDKTVLTDAVATIAQPLAPSRAGPPSVTARPPRQATPGRRPPARAAAAQALYLTVYGIGAPFARSGPGDREERPECAGHRPQSDRLIPISKLPSPLKRGAKPRTIPTLKALATNLNGKGIYLMRASAP
jgi:hypothetical protein